MSHAHAVAIKLVRSVVLTASLALPASLIAEESALDSSALPSIFGEYIELRSDLSRAIVESPQAQSGTVADSPRIAAHDEVFTEPPAPLRGLRRGRGFTHRSVLAWNIVHGSWNGQDISELSFALILESEGPIRGPLEGKRRAVLLLDQKADEDQCLAIKTLLSELVPKYSRDIVKVRRTRMRYEHDDHDVKLSVDRHLTLHVKTHEHDESSACQSVCGKDPQPTKPLSKYARIERALAKKDLYVGQDLPLRWNARDSGRTLAGQWGL